MNTQDHHIPTTPMGISTWKNDVSPKKCDVNMGGEGRRKEHDAIIGECDIIKHECGYRF
jgi:hypothetical protein